MKMDKIEDNDPREIVKGCVKTGSQGNNTMNVAVLHEMPGLCGEYLSVLH